MYTGKRVKKDKIHYSIRKLDSYDKKYNFVVTPRILGKSTVMWNKIYKKWKKYGLPALVVRRYEADITDTYIDAAEDAINTFLPEYKRIQFKYTKSAKTGFSEVYVGDKLFVRIIALNTKESRLKSAETATSLLFFDEFICNNTSENYVKDECNKLNSLYTTYSRAYIKYMKANYDSNKNYCWQCYFCGNCYSIYNPYFANLIKVDFSLIKPGAFIVGRNYVIDCPRLSKELLKWAIDNGIYDTEDDSEYIKYAFGGEYINDNHIRVEEKQPDGYQLKYIFRIQRKYIGMFKDSRSRESIGYDVGKYWCKELKQGQFSVSRKVLATDFDNLVAGSKLLNTDQRALLYILSQAISKRDISYQSVAVGYLVEEIYKLIK